MLGLTGRRNRLTRRGKLFAWKVASDCYLEIGNELDRDLTMDDKEAILKLAEEKMKTEVIPPIIWQIVLSYIAKLIIDWIIEQYIMPPSAPENLIGDDEE
jgi:hypothetical protein